MTTKNLEVTAPAVPDLDRPDADLLGDEILLASAATTKTARVSGSSSATQSHTARAWTSVGSVD